MRNAIIVIGGLAALAAAALASMRPEIERYLKIRAL